MDKNSVNYGRYTSIFDFFKENDVHPPEDVIKAIDEMFTENGEDPIDDISVYFKEDLDEFCQDLTLRMEANVVVNGYSHGYCYSVYTYYGELDISLSEYVRLYKSVDGTDEIIENITSIDNSEALTKNCNQGNFAVVLLEKTEYGDGEFKTIRTVHLYCPVSEN